MPRKRWGISCSCWYSGKKESPYPKLAKSQKYFIKIRTRTSSTKSPCVRTHEIRSVKASEKSSSWKVKINIGAT